MLESPASRKLLLAAAFAVFMLLGLFYIPYHLPVRPTVSISYLTGYNNRVAVATFVLAAFGIAFSLGGDIGEPEPEDSRLPKWLLGTSILAALVLTVTLELHRRFVGASGESRYFLDRLHQLSLHRTPYREFEFAYGPLLLYPPLWIHRISGLPLITAYYVTWVLFWCAGVAMFYFIVQNIDLPAPHRLTIYFLGIATLPISLLAEGVQYSPLRPYLVPFLAICTYKIWLSTKSPYGTACAAAAAVAIGFLVSADQGFGLLIGLSIFLALLVFRSREFPLGAFVLQLALSFSVFLTVSRSGEFLELHSYAEGGYNFPVLPSPANILVLGLFVLAVCLLWDRYLKCDLQHSHVVLTLCGMPMLSAAMGRSDLGHMISASSILLVGLFAVYSRRLLRRIFAPLLWGLLVIVVYGVLLLDTYQGRQRAKLLASNTPAAGASFSAPSRPIPTNVVYYSPYVTSVMQQTKGFLPFHMDQGFYSGFVDIMTQEQLGDELAEFERHRGMPLLLPDVPGVAATQPFIWDTEIAPLRRYEFSPYLPPAKHAPLSTKVLSDFLATNYRPTDMAQDGIRVWLYVGESTNFASRVLNPSVID